MLPPAVLAQLVEAQSLSPTVPSLGSLMPDLAASSALLGALGCSWTSSEEAPVALVSVYVAPIDIVPVDIRGGRSEFGCDWTGCGRAVSAGEVWVDVSAFARARDSVDGSLTPAELGRVETIVDAILGAVLSQPTEDLFGAPTPGVSAAPACETVEAGVTSALAMSDPREGFPSDFVPSGVEWDVATANGVAQWCAWYETNGNETTTVEMVFQASVGAPDQELLDASAATAVDIAAADAAYELAPNAIGTQGAFVVVVGESRVTVRGSAPALVAPVVPDLVVD